MKRKIQKYIIYIYIYIYTYYIYPQNLKLKMFFVDDIKVNLILLALTFQKNSNLLLCCLVFHIPTHCA